MKHMHKIASLLLALVMVFALATTAFAADTNSITVKNAVNGQTYKLYKMLDLSVNDAHTAYSYTVNSDWADFFKAAVGETPAGNGLNYVNIDAQGYVTWKKNADVAAFAKDAEEFAKNLSALDTKTPTTDGDITFSNLEAGYYLVTSTLGTKATVGTTPGEPHPAIQEKNQAPTNVKTVEEDSKVGVGGQDPWGSTNDADIGQTVNFKSTITAQPGAENYVFHDKMSAGLTLDKTSIKVDGTAVTDGQGNDFQGDNYTVSYPSGVDSDGCTFEIAFAQSYLDTITETTTITITYSATLNENALVGLPGNKNESKLSYGEISNTTGKPGSTTHPRETETYTWDMNVLKYGNGDEKKVLKDAQFVLLNSDKTKVATVVNGKITGWVDSNVTVVTDDEGKTTTTYPDTWDKSAILTTNADGKIEIDGLDADTYYLHEVKAPAGYNKLAEDVKVTITGATEQENEETGKTELVYNTVTAKVNNNSGTELPSTGGMGTTMFYVVGSILVLAAVVLLVTKKRMSNKG